jgi:hypothetical protein
MIIIGIIELIVIIIEIFKQLFIYSLSFFGVQYFSFILMKIFFINNIIIYKLVEVLIIYVLLNFKRLIYILYF